MRHLLRDAKHIENFVKCENEFRQIIKDYAPKIQAILLEAGKLNKTGSIPKKQSDKLEAIRKELIVKYDLHYVSYTPKYSSVIPLELCKSFGVDHGHFEGAMYCTKKITIIDIDYTTGDFAAVEIPQENQLSVDQVQKDITTYKTTQEKIEKLQSENDSLLYGKLNFMIEG